MAARTSLTRATPDRTHNYIRLSPRPPAATQTRCANI